MKFPQKSTFLWIAFVGAAALSVAFTRWGSSGEGDYIRDIRNNTILFGEIYKQISHKYVEELDPKKFMRTGISAMLNATDPYTMLIEEDDNVQLQIITQGKYGGLGMLVGIKDEWPTVVEPPYEGTPALKAGIREGDRIIAIDGETTRGKSVSEVASKLRGEKGTAVSVTIRREGEPVPIEFRLIRAEIVIKDVEYAGMLDDGIGYIKLTRFSKNAENEVRSAIRELRSQNIKGLILDLRNNPGGLLQAAVGVADAVLPKGKPIVSTRGRLEEAQQEYLSESDPILADLPLVILINGLSASASEIVSGAVQDLDRGVVIGQPSFGKGLVQSVVGLTPDARLKLTTAKYYLPSGRLIQKEMYSKELLRNNGSNGVAEESEERPEFATESGRTVFGGGGIYPDMLLKPDTLSLFEQALVRKSMMFNYAVSYASSHENLQRGFTVTPEMLEDFRQFIQRKEFSYKTAVEMELDRLRQAAKYDGIVGAIEAHITEMESTIARTKEGDFDRSIDFIKQQLAIEISAKLWDARAKIEASFPDDLELKRAITLLQQPEEYKALLASSHSKNR